MSAPEMVDDDPVEAVVLERARRNFLDNGPGDRMWSDPSPMKGSTMSAGFALSADQRAAFVAAARREIASEEAPTDQSEGSLLPSEGSSAVIGILALYQNPSKAQAATATLVAAGIPERAIQLVVAPSDPDDGLRDRLRTIGVAPEALDACCARLRQGAAMLNFAVADAQQDRVMGILKDHGTVDPALRLATWHAEGGAARHPSRRRVGAAIPPPRPVRRTSRRDGNKPMVPFAPVQAEKNDLDAVRRYAVSVIAQSEGEDLQMKAVTLALLGGIMWRAAPGSTEIIQDPAGDKVILSTTLGGRHLTFTYDQNTEAIEMREGTTDGPVVHRFCNRTLINDLEQTFSTLWD